MLVADGAGLANAVCVASTPTDRYYYRRRRTTHGPLRKLKSDNVLPGKPLTTRHLKLGNFLKHTSVHVRSR